MQKKLNMSKTLNRSISIIDFSNKFVSEVKTNKYFLMYSVELMNLHHSNSRKVRMRYLVILEKKLSEMVGYNITNICQLQEVMNSIWINFI